MIKIDGVSVVIPSFNGKVLLENNLPFIIKAADNPSNKIGEIVIVDDGSNDGTVNFIQKYYKNIKIVVSKKNRGFVSSVNIGVKSAKRKYVALINNDVEVSKDFLESPLKILRDDKVFAVSFHENGYGPAYGDFRDGFIVHQGQKEYDVSPKTFWVSGGSGIFRRDVFLQLGGMDEKLLSPFYWEDIDISYRAQKRGFKIFWDPNSNVIHKHESTTGKISQSYRIRIQERNQLLFIWKNLTSNNLLQKHIKGLIKRIILHPRYVFIVLLALMKIQAVCKLRKIEIKESTVSDEEIFSSFNQN